MKQQAKIWHIVITLLIIVVSVGCAHHPPLSEPTTEAAFTSVVLGAKGGLNEADLTAYLLVTADSPDFVALDAGTLYAGLQQAVQRGSFPKVDVPEDSNLSRAGWVLHNQIKAYLISHAHLDHVAGLVLNSPDDTAKPIMGLPVTIDNIRDHLFNWKIWPNFGNEGEGFQLKQYEYVRLMPGEEYAIPNTTMTVRPFELSHSAGYLSTAFLIESGGEYILFCGDTGPDAVEESDKLHQVWEAVAPLMRAGKLHGLFLEVSYPNDRPDDALFGHLTPKWMLTELHNFAELVNPEQPETALAGLKVVVIAIKPSLNRGEDTAEIIMRELAELNDLGVEFIRPESGQRLVF